MDIPNQKSITRNFNSMTKTGLLFFAGLFLGIQTLSAQADRWQQRAAYEMEIDFDVEKHQFTGKQQLTYFNNSPDTLDRVFYHLFFNAFQPGSMMDVRSRTISDPDRRVRDRISKLSESEIGYLRVQKLKQDGAMTDFEVVGTILEVSLATPLLPNSKTVLEMDFTGQVPIQVRRSGRDNAEGIDYSMAQWYPKLSEYDYQGWHANPYIGREFYGVWADFDVKIAIDKNYTIAATGYLQNPNKIGHGYEAAGTSVKTPKKDKLEWHFKANDVHDFLWAADPDYEHLVLERADGNALHFFFQPGEKTTDNWSRLPKVMDEAFAYINQHFGQYEYDKYSFIQGGDGGMEYPMATLITGERSFGSLVGVSVHELMHSWYQMMLGTNESLYAWMDEGFTSYASSRVMNHLRQKGLIPGNVADNPHLGSYAGYINLARTPMEEPLSTHSDHFMTNRAYGTGSYSKGAVFLNQMEYIIGKEHFDIALLKYFNTWKLKHPNVNDCIRIFEKTSGLELDWYKEYWVNTTHTIDYAVSKIADGADGKAVVSLEKRGMMPMPIDVVVTYTDGRKETINIPLQIMRGHKSPESKNFRTAPDWPWTNFSYNLMLDVALDQIEKVEIDPSRRMADIDNENNSLER